MGLVPLACDDPREATETTYLIVQVAGTQPQSRSLGVPVAIQQNGGTLLRMRAVAGTLRLTPDSAPRATACVPVPASRDGVLYVDVLPDDVEALFFVDLVGPEDASSGGASDEAGAEGGAGDLLAECPGAALRNRIVPVGGPAQRPAAAADAGEEAARPDASEAGEAGLDAAPTDGGAE